MLFNVDVNILIFIFFCRYIPVWDIIDARWELQLHRPLHAFAYWLNPHYHYITDYKQDKILNMECMTAWIGWCLMK